MSEELKPCPFCGGKGRGYQNEHSRYIIECDGCGVRTLDFHTKEKAIEAWNKRSAGIKDLLTGEDTGLTPEDLLKMVQEQLARLLSQNSQITQQSQLLYQEIRNCQGLIEQLRTY